MKELDLHFIPEKPKVNNKQDFELYMPVAGYNQTGIASFDSKHFKVDARGNIRLRKFSEKAIVDFTIDGTTGIGTITYDNGTTNTIKFPIVTNDKYTKTSLLNILEFTKDSFVKDTNGAYVAFTSSQTGYTDNKFIASLEEYSVDAESVGYYTVVDTLFKGSDGSILVAVDNEESTFDGRLLLLGGDVFTDTQVAALNYDDVNQVLKITYAEQDNEGNRKIEYVDFVSREYLEHEINSRLSSMYNFQGTLNLDELAELELVKENLNNVYLVTSSFITDKRFTEGPGVKFDAGVNVAVVDKNDEIKLTVMGWYINLSNYTDKIRNGTGPDSVMQINAFGAPFSNSAAFGLGTISAFPNQFVVGMYNKTTNDLFTVGCGTDNNNRKNAFAVKQNGWYADTISGGSVSLLTSILPSGNHTYYLPNTKGVAVVLATNVDLVGKVDKYVGQLSYDLVYGVSVDTGEQAHFTITETAYLMPTIPRRTSNGTLKSLAPVDADDCVNKGWADAKYATIERLI